MPRDSAAADRPASYLVGTAAAFPLLFRDRTKPINQLPFSPSAKFPKSGSSCESRVKRLRLETGEAAGDGLEPLADGIEMVQSLLETEIGGVVGDQLVAQEGGKLFVLLQKRVFEVV